MFLIWQPFNNHFNTLADAGTEILPVAYISVHGTVLYIKFHGFVHTVYGNASASNIAR